VVQIMISPPLISSFVELPERQICDYDRSKSTESQVQEANQLLKEMHLVLKRQQGRPGLFT
jgi:hypothetical protein